jgi:hypothetical protein
MAFDLAWLRASDAQALAAAPSSWRGTRFPRVLLIVAGAGLIASVVTGWINSVTNGDATLAMLLAFAVTVFAGGFAGWALWQRHLEPILLRLHLTADANGFVFHEDGLTDVDFVLKHAGDDLEGKRYFARPDGAEFGSLVYTTGSGKNRTTHPWHYVAARLPAALPHMMLDARSNDFLGSDLPGTYLKRGRLSLEGDFDSSFRLYAPMDYQQDALYLLTPDLMAVLVDNAADVNIEISGDRVIFFAEFDLDYESADEWREVDRLLGTVVPKLADRAARWARRV